MPSIKAIRAAFPELKDLSDYELADIYSAGEGISPVYGRALLGVEQRNQTLTEDIGTAIKQGAYRLPGAVAGLIDMPVAAVMAYRPFTKGLEALGEFTGIRPGSRADELEWTLSEQWSRKYERTNQ